MEEGNKGDNGGEVRRVNIVYFLSRCGHVEHPHLLRLHHHSRNGVFLRDVKKWLADARGNAMPDTFSWSYKRRYKSGYVWQDLLDDDLITPISDNEYVLKGSEILQSSTKEHSPFVEKKAWGSRNGDGPEESLRHSTSTESSRKSTSGVYKESPVFGSRRSSSTTATTVTDESVTTNEEETSTVPRTQNLNNSDEIQKQCRKNSRDSDGSGRPSVSSGSYTRSKSYSSGASHVLRSLMTCGSLDINDTVLMPLNRFSKAPPCADWEDEHRHHYQQQHNARKSFDGAWSGLKMKEKIEFCRSKAATGPICSQCGKSFKPEKMHSHMKMCRGMKNSAKTVAKGETKTASQRQGISRDSVLPRQYALAAQSLVRE